MPRIEFSKYEGLGNDFIIVEASQLGARELSSADAIALCDRHLGIGADGVLIVETGSAPRMAVINSDGSRPEMCGNGIRCVAAYLLRAGAVTPGRVDIDTVSGPHRCDIVQEYGDLFVDVAMRPPSFEPDAVGLDSEHAWVDQPLDVNGTQLSVTAVSVGNPHVVLFDDVGDARLELAPAIQTHPKLSRGANVGFAQMRARDAMHLHVYERGAGWTQACGTGACAAVSAAVETGRVDRATPVRVTLPGGELTITVNEAGEPVHMRGPARHVFDGVIDLP